MKRTFILFLFLVQMLFSISAQDADSLYSKSFLALRTETPDFTLMTPNGQSFPKNENTLKKEIDITPVQEFDLDRYLGRWYEIARLDNRFERGLSDVTAEYIPQKNDMIKVQNSGFDAKIGKRRQAIGRAKTTDVAGVLRVSFFWIFYSDYIVLALGDNYEWALVGSGRSGKYLWILSRTEVLPKETMERILSEAERRGYDTKQLLFSHR
jgi:apolipoprotein D and lipocalin family protein